MMGQGATVRAMPMMADEFAGSIPDMHTVIAVAGGAVVGAITLPNIHKTWYLRRVEEEGGAGAGSFALAWDGTQKARFPVGNGLPARWKVNWKLPSNIIPSANQIVEGDANPETVVLTFGSAPEPGAPDISAYRSILIKSTQAGANTVLLALAAASFDLSSAVPDWIIAFTTADDAQVFFPATGGPQGGLMCLLDSKSYWIASQGAPVGIPPNDTIVVSVENEGACHFTIYVGYHSLLQQ